MSHLTGHGRVLVPALVAVVLTAAGCTPQSPQPAGGDPSPGATVEFQPGETGIGDPYFPSYGNRGYDAGHYHLEVTYDPASQELAGSATITATATENLSRFSLDLSGLTVREVTVDGNAAKLDRDGAKLTVTPPAGVPAGTEFRVEVSYDGVPEPVGHPQLGDNGFHHTDDGAFAIGEPQSASTWFPVNDHPLDKATYAIEVTVPEGLVAVSNGVPEDESTSDGWTTWRWVESSPMASYLTTLAIGDYRVHRSEHAGRPMVVAVHSDLPTAVDRQLERTGEIADVLSEEWFGPYPFDSYGGIVLGDDRIGFALETQSRPIYGPVFFRDRGDGIDGTWVIVHELAHQWFGNSVSVHHWNDIWLNEGFATYAEWLWAEHTGGPPVQQTFDSIYDTARPDFWNVPPGDPGADQLFHSAVYRRGAMTLHALRRAVGDDDFFRIVRTWADERAGGNATTADLVALSQRISGESLDGLFDEWLYTDQQPDHPDR